MDSSVEKKWMVKSENTILGPYTFEQLEDLLKKKQISLIDEVRDMDTRWLYIREATSLKSIVDNVRKDIENQSEMTLTYQMDSVSKTVEVSRLADLTKTENKNLDDTQAVVQTAATQTAVTQTATPVVGEVKADNGFNFAQAKLVEPTEAEVVHETSTAPMAADKKMQQPQKKTQKFVSEKDPQIQSGLKKRTQITMIVVLSLIFGLVITAGSLFYYKNESQKRLEFNQLNQIKKFATLGLEDQLIESYKKLPSHLKKIALIDMTSALNRLETEGLISAEELEYVRKYPQLSQQQKVEIELTDFSHKIIQGDLKTAKEIIIKAKDINQGNELVKENEAILSFYEADYVKSSGLFFDLYKATNKGRFLLGYALSQLQLDQADLNSVINEIDRFNVYRIDFKKELLYSLALAYKKVGKSQDYILTFEAFKDFPSLLDRYFRLSSLVPREFYNLSHVIDITESINRDASIDQKFIVAFNRAIDKNELNFAEQVLKNSQNLFSDKQVQTEFEIQLAFAQKKYEQVLALEKIISPEKMTLKTHLAVFLSQINLNKPYALAQVHKDYLDKDKNLFSLWTQILIEKDKDKNFSFVQLNSVNTEDFIPFLEIKGNE